MLSRDLNSFHFPFAQQSSIPVLTPLTLSVLVRFRRIFPAPSVIGAFSLFLSVANMILDFPKQLFDIAQREGEAHVFALQAEEKSEFWTQKMEVEVQQQQEDMLVMSAQESANQGGAPIQKPLSIIRKVMDLEADCMRARVDYVAHQMFMALHESEQRQAIRSGTLPNPYAKKPSEEEDDAEESDGEEDDDEESGRGRGRGASLTLPPPREGADGDGVGRATGAMPSGGAPSQLSQRGLESNRSQKLSA